MSDEVTVKNGVQPGITPALSTSQSIEIQRTALQNETGYSLQDSVHRLQKIATGRLKQRIRVDGKYKTITVPIPVSAMVAAENSIESKMGWKAAEKIHITQHTLFTNLNDMSEKDLEALIGDTAPCVS